MNPVDKIWTEKYRPKKVADVIGEAKEKVLKYMENVDNIPSLIFYSKSPGTGKCVIGEELFFTKNGITSFYDYFNKTNNNEDVKIINKQDKVFDPKNNFVSTEYFYHNIDDVYSVRTKKGFSITGTKNHRIKIFDVKHGLIWKKISDIKKDDIIPIVFDTNIFGNNDKFIIKSFIKKKYDVNSNKIKIPKIMNKNIAYFLGVFLANGGFDENNIQISSFKPYINKKIKKIINDNFGLNSKIKIINNKEVGINIFSVQLKWFMKEICGCSDNTARYKSIPKKIFECSKDVQVSFLDGLFEDSYISKEGCIEYYTASEKLAKEIHIILLNIGIFSTHRYKRVKGYDHTYHTIALYQEYSKKLVDMFGGYYKGKKYVFRDIKNNSNLGNGIIFREFVSNKRKENNITKNIVFKKEYIGVRNIPKGITSFKNNAKKLLDEPYLSDLDIFFKYSVFLDRVVAVTDVGKKEIFDFHIPKTHSFLASGMINHNTTMAKAIINDLGCDSITLNSSDDRKIEVIRDTVKEFAKTKSSNGIRKCIFMDEFDGMLKASQEALRNMMETYSNNVFFILTANNINKIHDAIQSRCKVIHFAYPPKEDIVKYLITICQNENLEFTPDGIQTLVDKRYPSIRDCVVTLQDLHTDGLTVTVENINSDNPLFENMWNFYKDKNWQAIKEEVMATTIDPRELNTFFWLEGVKSNNIKMIQLTCMNEKAMSTGADPKIVFVTSLIDMVK